MQQDRTNHVHDHLLISRPDQLQALGDPTRWRILGRLLDGPASIQELARSLNVAKGTIGHHVRVLDDAGLIRLAETNRVRGVTEKRYARVAKQFRLPEGEARAASGHPDLGTLPLRQAIAEARQATEPDDPSMSVVVRARMPLARAQRFARLLNDLVQEFADGAPGKGETFGLVAGLYVPDWADTTERLS
jgi:DNA-binding transcriptional ArsR family regulator